MSIVHSARLVDGTGAPPVDDAWVATRAGRVTAVGTGNGWRRLRADLVDGEEPTDGGGGWLVPGSVDLHRHGGGGHLHEDGPAAVLAAAEAHLGGGTTRGVVSFVADDVDVLAERLAGVADLLEDTGSRAAARPAAGLLLGSHLEGPFLAVGRKGAHDARHLVDPSPAAVDHLVAAARGTLRQVTLDPRRDGAADAARRFRTAGAVVAVGHTEAAFEEARAAFDGGARLLTHAFNAMPGIHHRAPGPVVAALEDERVVLELVLDGEHVHPAVAALLLAGAPGRVALVTDAMAAAALPGPPPAGGRYRLGGLEVEVVRGRAVLAGTEVLAGSTLTQDAALRIGVAAGLPLPVLVRASTSTPARVLGLHDQGVGVLAAGSPADLVLLDARLRVSGVWWAGRRVVAGVTA